MDQKGNITRERWTQRLQRPTLALTLHSTRLDTSTHTHKKTRVGGVQGPHHQGEFTLCESMYVPIQSRSLASTISFISNRFIHIFSNKFSISSSDIFISITITKWLSLQLEK